MPTANCWWGDFTEINGQAAGYVARLNANGILDAVFAAACNGVVNSTVVQVDGKLVLGGRFTYAAGVARAGLVRLLPAGTLDAAFAPPLQPSVALPFSGGQGVRQIAIQPDGNLLLSGFFDLRPSATASPQILARVLGTTGQRDVTFVPADSTGNFSLLMQADGRIVVGGATRELLPTATLPVLVWRLLPSGTLDASFPLTPVNSLGNSVNLQQVPPLATDANGRIYIGGRFTGFGAVPTQHVAWLLPSGTPDPAFVVGLAGTVYSVGALTVQPNGRVLVGAALTRNATDYGLVRLLPTGIEDASFIPTSGPSQEVLRLLVAPGGAILAAGTFRQASGIPVGGLVRLLDGNVLSVSSQHAAVRLDAWPIPAHDNLYLRLTDVTAPQQAQLLDALGRIVLTQSITHPELTLRTTGLPSGVYLLRVTPADRILS